MLGDDPLGAVGDGQRDAGAGPEAQTVERVRERVPRAVELPVGVHVLVEVQRDLLRVPVGGVLEEVVQRAFRVVQRRAAEHGLLEGLGRLDEGVKYGCWHCGRQPRPPPPERLS